jgi:predicted nuclease with RNAse H fold
MRGRLFVERHLEISGRQRGRFLRAKHFFSIRQCIDIHVSRNFWRTGMKIIECHPRTFWSTRRLILESSSSLLEGRELFSCVAATRIHEDI